MRKKLFAILMSAMMMVTFMPAMAFADASVCPATAEHQATWYVNPDSVEWNADYTAATGDVYCGKDGKLVKADVPAKTYTKTFNNFGLDKTDAGFTTVTAQWADGLKVGKEEAKEVATAKYVDITDATLVVDTNEITADEYIAYVNEYKAKGGKLYLGEVFNVKAVTLKAPAGAKNALPYGPATVTVLPMYSDIMEALAHSVYTEAVAYDAYEEGTYTLTLKVDEEKVPAGIDIFGTTTVDIKIVKGATYNYLTYALEGYVNADKKDTFLAATTPEITYDGADHAITCVSKNVNVEFASNKYVGTDGKVKTATTETNKNLVWVASPAVKNAGTYTFFVRVKTSSDTSIKAPTYVYQTINVKVAKRNATYGFVQEAMTVPYGTVKAPEDILQFNNIVEADKVALATILEKTCVLKGFFTEAGSSTIELLEKMPGEYELTEDEATLFGNYHFIVINHLDEMWLTIVQADNEVTCPTTNKVVKASKVKKAAQKVAVKTTAKFGEVKLTKVSGSAKLKVNGNKIVVKKGTKKGTYKIKVRASVVGTANYAGAKLTKTITIKVK